MVVRRNKSIVESKPDIRPDPVFFTPNQDKIVKFIKKHPNCTRRDIYSISKGEDGHIRRDLLKLLTSRRVKETFTIVQD